ncbi:MAG: methyltransferase [Flavobacteriales bacterium]|nr:MAG: methyltransferase [Flavobacteriales bacterium]
MRKLLVRLLHPLLRKWYSVHNAAPRHYRANGLDLVVLPGVFHPGFFHSTALLAEHITTLDLNGQRFLELGAGTGRVALTAARAGAVVTASDINPKAVENVRINAARNNLAVDAVQSDLFDQLPGHFDLIAINPPYYRRDPATDAERAFLAGADHQYFRRLFPVLAPRIDRGTRVMMVVSADVDLAPVAAIAKQSGLHFTEVRRKKRWGEAQVIFAVHR